MASVASKFNIVQIGLTFVVEDQPAEKEPNKLGSVMM